MLQQERADSFDFRVATTPVSITRVTVDWGLAYYSRHLSCRCPTSYEITALYFVQTTTTSLEALLATC